MTLTSALDCAVTAARAAGDLLQSQMDIDQTVLDSTGRDIKLAADQQTERVIIDALACSGYPILAEESGEHGAVARADRVWVVDPLDGTMNYSREIPFFGVSIALLVDGAPTVGVILDVARDELFTGIVGEGAWLDGKPLSVSHITEPAKAILATGLPTHRDFDEASLVEFAAILGRFKKVRMLGSAALMLAYVAAGRVDAYCEDDIMWWDVAAGVALVRAAGGVVTVCPSQKKTWSRFVRCAASPSLWG